jgi:hypothetical protein
MCQEFVKFEGAMTVIGINLAGERRDNKLASPPTTNIPLSPHHVLSRVLDLWERAFRFILPDSARHHVPRRVFG